MIGFDGGDQAKMESDAQGEKIREEYDSVCNKLNMDQSSMERAWTSYSDIRDYYTLEVAS